MLIFHLQSGIWEFHFPFTCNLYGKCFGISVTHLTSDLEVPGSSPGVSNNLFVFTFFSFWPFTVPSPLNIKTRRIANNVINNHIYFIITLLSLDPLIFACNPYGRWLFLKSGFYIHVFCEQYHRYFSLIFVDFWVCCSWDYILSKCSPHFFQSDVIMVCWWSSTSSWSSSSSSPLLSRSSSSWSSSWSSLFTCLYNFYLFQYSTYYNLSLDLKTDHLIRPRDDLNSSNLIGIAQTLTFFLFLPYTFLCTRLLEIDKVNFLRISVSHQALWFQV